MTATTRLAIAAALTLAAGAVPASAATPAATAVAAKSAATVKPAAKRYCVEDTHTGTRIPRRTCRTRADWLALGLDPAALKD